MKSETDSNNEDILRRFDQLSGGLVQMRQQTEREIEKSRRTQSILDSLIVELDAIRTEVMSNTND